MTRLLLLLLLALLLLLLLALLLLALLLCAVGHAGAPPRLRSPDNRRRV
jgi:hypothetical protein